MALVPALNISGNFVVQAPFTTNASTIYTVKALREFFDIYVQGIDVYNTYYAPVGLINGTNVNNTVFDFNTEAALNPTIVTLQGNDGTVMYIPSTYIISAPQNASVNYSRIIMGADLGAIPDTLDLTNLESDLAEMVASRYGITTTFLINRGYTDAQPTQTQADALEAARKGAITVNGNNFTLMNRYKQQATDLQKQVSTLTDILRQNNLLNGITIK